MSDSGSYKGVQRRFDACPPEVKAYFQHVPTLIRDYPWEVLVAYLFMRVETAHNRAIHGGVVKLHRADVSVVTAVLDDHRMTRSDFVRLLQTVTDRKMPKELGGKLKRAEATRDRCVHGKEVSEAQARQTVIDVLDYAEGFNGFMKQVAGFQPFGDMRGFKGRLQALDKGTTRWLLLGMGFSKRKDAAPMGEPVPE